MRKLLVIVAVAATLLSLAPPRIGFGDGSEELGPPTSQVATRASAIAVAGTGLFKLPATIDLDLPANASIQQVLLYWEGEFQGGGEGGHTIDVNGRDIRGTLIGGPSRFFPQSTGDVFSSSYRADVTDLDLIAAGSNRLVIGGLGYNYRNDGAGVLVLYDDGSPPKDIQIRDGNDNAYFEFAPPVDTTAPQTFTFDADTVERTATLAFMVGSVGHDRPNAAVITTGDVTTRLVNLLSDNAGDEWDALTIPVTIPAGATTATVQLLSESDGTDRRPASLTWVMSSLALQPSSAVENLGPAQPAGLEGIEVAVDKTNDADGNGTFSDREVARGPGSTVAFRVRLTNPTATPVLIQALTDAFPTDRPTVVLDLLRAAGGRLVANTCTALAGQIVQPGGSTLSTGAPAECTFTVADYSPPAGTVLQDVVGVRVSEVDNPDNVAGGFDTSDVGSVAPAPPFALPRAGPAFPAGGRVPEAEAAAPPQQELAEVESQPGERVRQLARTGAAVLLLTLFGCALIVVGVSLLREPGRRGTAAP